MLRGAHHSGIERCILISARRTSIKHFDLDTVFGEMLGELAVFLVLIPPLDITGAQSLDEFTPLAARLLTSATLIVVLLIAYLVESRSWKARSVPGLRELSPQSSKGAVREYKSCRVKFAFINEFDRQTHCVNMRPAPYAAIGR